jgi:hypothetical protein
MAVVHDIAEGIVLLSLLCGRALENHGLDIIHTALYTSSLVVNFVFS